MKLCRCDHVSLRLPVASLNDLDTAAWRLPQPCRRFSCLRSSGSSLQRHLGEISGQMIILVLRPALERMVVAFVAIEARGEEQLRRVLHRFSGCAQNFPIAGGGIFAIGTGGRQNFAGKLVVRRVLFHLFANPGRGKSRRLPCRGTCCCIEASRPICSPNNPRTRDCRSVGRSTASRFTRVSRVSARNVRISSGEGGRPVRSR